MIAMIIKQDPTHDASEWRRLAKQPCGVFWNSTAAAMQADLVAEESTEFLQAFDRARLSGQHADKVACLKELADTAYVLYQFASALDIDLDEALHRVHASNLTKLVDGKLVKRADGKILKPDSYCPPDLDDLVCNPIGDEADHGNN